MTGPPKPTNRILAVLVVVLLFPLGYSLADTLISGGDAAPFLAQPATNSRTCVKGYDAKYMRYHHMYLLKEVRDRVIRDGHREDGIGLSQCRECHEERERFCNRCHDTVNLTPDCFGCHYYP
jgi:hypothetical protein